MSNDAESISSGSEYSSDVNSVHNSSQRDSSIADEVEHKFEKQVDKEYRWIRFTKAIVVGALVIAAAVVAIITYRVTKNSEIDEFEVAFEGFANDIITSSEAAAEAKFDVLENLANGITAHALDSGSGWPNVTLPFFEREVNSLLKISGAEFIAFAPLLDESEKSSWEDYSVANQGWLRDGLDFLGRTDVVLEPIIEEVYEKTFDDGSGTVAPNGTHVPLWQIFPAPTNSELVNKDLYSISFIRDKLESTVEIRHVLLTQVLDLEFLLRFSPIETYDSQARSMLIQPVYKSFDDDAEVGGFVFAILAWSTYFNGILPESEKGVVIQVEDTCGSSFAYRIDGSSATPVDLANEKIMKGYEISSDNFAVKARYDAVDGFSNACDYALHVYPTESFRERYETNGPLQVALIVAAAFVFSMATFLLYDFIVGQRQKKLQKTADKTTAIVNSLFPENVQERLMEGNTSTKGGRTKTLNSTNLNDYDLDSGSRPIADLFPDTTIMFADLVGFTAWSSAREPAQVFTLLETIYAAFDKIAKRRGVFKVETVGDCYVAAVGLPQPRKDHAVVMARFAHDCLHKMLSLVKELEVTLGPDTADLGMRFGLHSGPVTAGVLRGERARFQLFGDTMNSCSRIESTGRMNKIHISEATASLLIEAGKDHWVTARPDLVEAKGKGRMQTYWLAVGSSNSSTTNASETNSSETYSNVSDAMKPAQVDFLTATNNMAETPGSKLSEKKKRLVNWNVDILARILREIVTRRHNINAPKDSPSVILEFERDTLDRKSPVLEEIVEIIHLPEYTSNQVADEISPDSIELGPSVMSQLQEYVMTLAAMYRDNPFHNFEHASHVTMSVVKLLSRIVAPVHIEDNKTVHDNTYGITSDPLTQFAVVLSALIHDVDHPGVPNTQLVKEEQGIAKVYKNRSVAEQNSVDLAWDLLMDDTFADLRQVIYCNASEFTRFRQLVVNTVMATDIMDKDLKGLRNNRWERAFDGSHKDDSPRDTIDRKATIVIEHLIQASDVAHTMQHWHIYRKWNQRLFEELYLAYSNGRAAKDPSEFWYEGEIGFFDFYIIPLAKKLKECGVFGVSSDEYLTYALQNREEWKTRGKEVVAELIQGVQFSKNEKASTSVSPPKIEGTPEQRSSSANSA